MSFFKIIKKRLNPYSESEDSSKGVGEKASNKSENVSAKEETKLSDSEAKNNKDRIVGDNGEDRPSPLLDDKFINIEKTKDQIISSILKILNPYRGFDDFSGCSLWVSDAIFSIVDSEDFRDRLKVAFDNNYFESLGGGTIDVRQGWPDEGKTAVTKLPNYEIWINWQKRTEIRYKEARITIVEGTGSMAEMEYIINGDKSIYHIGRGKLDRRDNQYRLNDIVIRTDDPDADIQSNNNYVSQSQADIVFEEGAFYLKACRRGCRTYGGSPTKLIHNQDIIELRNTEALYPLYDGDMIELGKRVVLLFNLSE